MGVKVLRRIQIGIETTAGTPVAATKIWQGEGLATDAQERQFPVQGDGYLFKTSRSYLSKEGGKVSLDETPVTTEQLPYLLAAGVENVTTPADDGSGSGKIYQYDFPTTTPNAAPAALTIEGGDDQDVGEIEYCTLEKLTLKYAAGEEMPWSMSADLFGRQWTDTSFTSLSPATVHEINTAKLYLDNSGGTIGATQKTSTFLGLEVEIPSNWKPVPTGDGALTFTFVKYVGHKDNPIKGKLRLEHDATGDAEVAAARAGTVRLLRVVGEGAALTTAGTDYSKHTVIFSAAIQYDEVPELDDEDGNDVVELPFHVIYSDSITAQIIVVNEAAAL